MMLVVAAVVELLTFHMVDGRIILINPEQVTQLVHPTVDGDHAVLVDTVQCVIRLTDGTFVSVAETCDEVEHAMEALK